MRPGPVHGRARRLAGAAVAAVALALASGCATTPPGQAGATASSAVDPFESFNRKVYRFNEVVDDAVLKPVAEAYQAVVPALVRTGIGNVLGNLGDVWSAANHLLQGKLFQGLDMGMRVLTNTLFGLGGLLDPATEMGLVRRSEDFGQTLGRWGVGAGPYLVLPFMGPSTVRDGVALLVDRQADASRLPSTEAGRLAWTAVDLVHLRASLLGATQMLDQVALDKYSFVRDGYLQRRLSAVHDGALPAAAADEGDPGDSPPAPSTGSAPPAPAATPAAPPARPAAPARP